MNVHYVHVDSKNRDSNLYPHGNNYVLHLLNPIKNAVSVDLVTAKVPNSMYNLTNGTNVFSTSSVTVSIPPGFYSAFTLVTEINKKLNIRESIEYIQSEGRFIYLANESTSFITVNSEEMAKMLGLQFNITYTVSLLDSAQSGFSYGVKSDKVVDMSLNEFVFLDIEEFRTPFFDDAKSLPFSGLNAGNMFAVIPMDVPSTQVKTFKENTDYVMSMPIPQTTLSRLTIHWLDKNLHSLNFQGYENNGFVLRVHTSDPDKGKEENVIRPVDIEAQIESIKRKLMEEELLRADSKKEKKVRFGKWAIVLLLVALFLFWFISKKTM